MEYSEEINYFAKKLRRSWTEIITTKSVQHNPTYGSINMQEIKHYSFDLWFTLIKSNPKFKEERAKFFHRNLPLLEFFNFFAVSNMPDFDFLGYICFFDNS